MNWTIVGLMLVTFAGSAIVAVMLCMLEEFIEVRIGMGWSLLIVFGLLVGGISLTAGLLAGSP